MDIYKKLEQHLTEAMIHIERIVVVRDTLEKYYPLNTEKLENFSSENIDKLDVLAFRFSKLQDLLGSKIFREYLTVLQYPVEDKNFLELLKELDKENIIEIDMWSEFRGVRNSISHDYPFEESERLEAMNYLIENVKYLVTITKKIKDSFETLNR
jgi:hypothetical protein